MKTIDKHLFQAMDCYPYNLEEAVESLEYALSYDSQNTMALCLMGRIYAEQLLNYQIAVKYFQEALSYNIDALEVYPHYINTLILNEDLEEAEKLIVFALSIKGINKTEILLKKAGLAEIKQEFKAAKKLIKEIKLINCNQEMNSAVSEISERIKSKLKLVSKKKSN